MKRILPFLFTLLLALGLTACGSNPENSTASSPAPDGSVSASVPPESPSASQPESPAPTQSFPASQPVNPTPAESDGQEETDGNETKILVAYFSATNNTEGIANHLQSILDADLYEIVPETPYTSDDLNYNDSSSRSSQEMDDPDARPAISGGVEDMDQYEVIFLGYPIWWGEAPRIINTFLESYDLSGKTIAPFCTSASSPLGSSAAKLQDLTGSATWLDGRRFSGGASLDEVQSWVDSLNLKD